MADYFSEAMKLKKMQLDKRKEKDLEERKENLKRKHKVNNNRKKRKMLNSISTSED